jgi:septum site-determining protein MinD
MGRTIVITSGKGGVGKTTACANIGYALAKKGQEVLLIDMDLGLRNLDTVLGLENRVVFDIVDVIENKCRIKQAIIRDKRNEHLSLMPASQTRDKNALTEENMKDLLSELRNQYDYVLIDCPAGIEQGFKNAIAGADEALVICTPEVSSVRDADRVIGIMASSGIGHIDLVINRIKPELVRSGDMLSKEDVEDILGQNAIGVIIDDSSVVRATNLGESAINLPNSRAGKEYENIAGRLMGEKIPINSLNPIGALIDKLFSKKAAV